MTTRPDTELLVPVLVAGNCVGHVLSRGVGGFEAFDRNDRVVGVYRTQKEAIAALMKGRS